MAIDAFIWFDGFKGEAQDSKHKDEIDVLSFSWGATNSGSSHLAGGGGAGMVDVQDLTFTKYTDKSSSELLKACHQSTPIKKAVLTVRNAGGKNPVEFLKITLSDLLVSSVSFGASGGDDRPTESVTLNFTKIEYGYTDQKIDGTPGSNFGFTYDTKQRTVS
jgi:type VI secretion system secreted protein Hcp